MNARAHLLAVPDDIDLWVSAVTANGGTVSAAREAIVNTFIAAEKAAGNWALTDDYWALWGESAVQGLTSLKQRRLATVVAAPTFTADRGYLFNGTTNYINSGFQPSSHAVALSGTNQRIAVYVRNQTALSAYSLAASNSSAAAGSLSMMARTATNTVLGQMNAASVQIASLATTLGLTAVSRANGTTTINLYRNGAFQASGTATAPVSILITHNLYIGARNLNGTADAFRADSTGFACVGAPLSASQETAQYNAVQAWATSIGANV